MTRLLLEYGHASVVALPEELRAAHTGGTGGDFPLLRALRARLAALIRHVRPDSPPRLRATTARVQQDAPSRARVGLSISQPRDNYDIFISELAAGAHALRAPN
jgi:hypothetical protein